MVAASAHSVSTKRAVPPSGQLGGAFAKSSVTSAEKALAQGGIATVSNESSDKALVAVHGPIRMHFTEAQVRSMALQAADGGGITGSTLDSIAALPSDYPPLSYLLASWISGSKSTAAKTVHSIMGNADWKDAPKLVFPTIALPLFVGDVIKASPPPAAADTAVIQTIPYETSNAPDVELAGLTNAPCSSASGFIQSPWQRYSRPSKSTPRPEPERPARSEASSSVSGTVPSPWLRR
jgi:hypothetical protein